MIKVNPNSTHCTDEVVLVLFTEDAEWGLNMNVIKQLSWNLVLAKNSVNILSQIDLSFRKAIYIESLHSSCHARQYSHLYTAEHLS